jgi:hypothetical protein
MGYTHYWDFKSVRGTANQTEQAYQRAIKDCQRVIRRYYKENGGLSGYTAHCKIGAYSGISVNGAASEGCETFTLREHFNQNESDFCKTARYPYDTVIVACLAILKHRLGDNMEVSSDGNSEEWKDGINLARKVTGLKIANPIGGKKIAA